MISVIVPVYKVEKYLDKCVQSILAQTYRDFELILVDDGSPDNCPQMCDEYAKQDKRVRVIHKKNGGLSDARNAGTSIANGEWVTYIDSDDYVSEDYLAALYNMHIKYNADICVGGLCTFFEGDEPIVHKNVNERIFEGIEALEHVLYQNMLDTSACAMLIPIEIARVNPFPVGKYHEDEFTTYKYYISVNKVAVTSKSLYFYLQRRGSIMHVFGQASIDEIEAADNLVKECENNWPSLISAAKAKKFSDYCQVLLSANNTDNDEIELYDKICDFLLSYRVSMLFDGKARIKNRAAALALLIGGVRMLIIFNSIRK